MSLTWDRLSGSNKFFGYCRVSTKMDRSIPSRISKRSPFSGKRKSSLAYRPSSLSEEDYWLAPKEARSSNCTSTSLTRSESLLDTLAELEAAQIERKNWLERLFTPIGVSSILVILLTNVIASSLLFMNGKSELNAAVTGEQQDKLARSDLFNSPNLAQQEFVDLNLANLSTLTKPGVKSKFHHRSRSTNSNKPQTKPKPIRSQPITRAILPGVNSTPTAGYTIPSAALTNTNYYYVLTEYSGALSLQQAKRKVGHVSLINFPQGLFIYMGAFYDREDANRFVEQLGQQGIMAYTYHPE
jgi:cell division septation protein DedD